MASTWRFQQENSTRLARLGLTDPSSGIQSRQMPFVEGGGPDDKQGSVLADALNVHEATGLTPSQLQARVAELEGAIARIEAEALMEDGFTAESDLWEAIMDARNA